MCLRCTLAGRRDALKMPSMNPACKRCALWENARTVCIAGRGPERADLLVVGHSPGYKEDRIGEPFVGDSGTLLNRLLREVDSSIPIRITNAVKCRPPDNRKPTII